MGYWWCAERLGVEGLKAEGLVFDVVVLYTGLPVWGFQFGLREQPLQNDDDDDDDEAEIGGGRV